MCLGAILGYSVHVMSDNEVLSTYNTNAMSIVTSQLMCCSNYSYSVSARNSAGHGETSEAVFFMTSGFYDGKYATVTCLYIDAYNIVSVRY